MASKLRTLGRFVKRISLFAVVLLLVVGYLTRELGSAGSQVRRPPPAPAETAESTASVEAETERPATSATAKSRRIAGARRLDAVLEDHWREAGVEVAGDADWLTVCRRLSLGLVGSGLPLEEIRRLEALPEDERVEWQLKRLLADPRYHDYWAERFTRMFVGADDGPFITFRRRRFRFWLSDAIAANRPLDRLISDLVTARGLPTDRPEVNFLTVTMDSGEEGQPDPIRLAARVSRSMLGLRIDCLQCHDDFLGNVSLEADDRQPGELRHGTQQDFHRLAAFFAPARFSGLQGIGETDHAYQYQYLDAEEEVEVEPAVPLARHLLPESGTPRERLAGWLTHPENHQVSLHLAGRVWALMVGRPLTETIDNLPLDSSPHPALRVLADELVDSGYDLRHLIGVIALSQAFGLDSEADFEITDRHEAELSVFPLSRLRPEQVAASVIQAARVKTVDRDSSLIVQLQRFGGVNDFVTRYGDISEDEFQQETITITQRLLMLNGKLVREYGEREPLLNATSHINLFARDDGEAIDNVYLCVLNRYPDADERETFLKRFAEARPERSSSAADSDSVDVAQPAGLGSWGGLFNRAASRPRERMIEDLFWVLVNSSEFSWNH